MFDYEEATVHFPVDSIFFRFLSMLLLIMVKVMQLTGLHGLLIHDYTVKGVES